MLKKSRFFGCIFLVALLLFLFILLLFCRLFIHLLLLCLFFPFIIPLRQIALECLVILCLFVRVHLFLICCHCFVRLIRISFLLFLHSAPSILRRVIWQFHQSSNQDSFPVIAVDYHRQR